MSFVSCQRIQPQQDYCGQVRLLRLMASEAEETRRLHTIAKFLSQVEAGECVGAHWSGAATFPKDFNLEVRSDGACRVQEIVKLLWYERWVRCTVVDLRAIVDNDQKGRFALDVGAGTIRATQGSRRWASPTST